MTGEQQIEPVAAAPPVPYCVRPTRLDAREVGLHSDLAHARDEIACNFALFAGRAADVHEVRQQRDDVFAGNADGHLLEIGMNHADVYPSFFIGARAAGRERPVYFIRTLLVLIAAVSISESAGIRIIPDVYRGIWPLIYS